MSENTTTTTTQRVEACPPGSQKCVSTRDTQEYCAMEPVAFVGSSADAQAAVEAVVAAYPRTKVEAVVPGYLRATFRTKVFRFKDTVEFEIDEDARLIHYRSESVPFAGSDLGANRRRMTEVREMLVERLG